MRGIIFKELYISRKKIYISIATYFFLMLLCVLVKMSAEFGNIRLLDKEAVENTLNIAFYFFVFGLLVVFTGFLVNNVSADLKSHWSIYQRTLPFTERQLVGAGYITNAVVLLVLFVFHTLMTAIMCMVFNMKFHAYYIWIFLLASLLFFLANALIMFAFYRFRDKRKATLFYSAFFVIVYLAFEFAFISRISYYETRGKQEAEQLAALQGLPAATYSSDSFQAQYVLEDFQSLARFIQDYWWLIAVIIAAVIAVLFFASVKALARPADAVKPSKEKEKTKHSLFGSLGRQKAASEGDDD